MKYKHKIIDNITPLWEYKLDELSEQGWELVSVVKIADRIYHFFKKPITE